MNWQLLKPLGEWAKANTKLLIFCAVGLVIGWQVRGCLSPIVGDPDRGMGWIDDPKYVKDTVATFANPFFGDVAKNIVQGDENKDAFVWKFYKEVTGQEWQSHDQDGTGMCVGEGFSAALELLQCVEIKVNGDQEEYKPISAAAIYALSREMNGMLGKGDGSTGAAAAKAMLQFGCVSCEDAKDDNTTGKEHAALAKKWGGRDGLPAELKALAAKNKIKSASMVRTPEECRVALANGYPIAICSNVGFEPRGGFKRDGDGFVAMGGTWPHCMCIAGYRADKKAFLVIQSWGSNSPPGPKSLGQPDGSFWITWDACQRIVRSGESYALSAFDGYPKRNIDNFIMAPAPKREYVKVRDLLRDTFTLAP